MRPPAPVALVLGLGFLAAGVAGSSGAVACGKGATSGTEPIRAGGRERTVVHRRTR
jgi:hypothetical protein